MIQKLEVRCCCAPKQLLGWLPADSNREYVCFALSDPLDRSYKSVVKAPETVLLPIREIFVPEKGYYYAISSDETPVEKLRRIPEFVENR
jgi:hypothetical protein